MKQETVAVDRALFRSGLLVPAAVLMTLAALMGLPGLWNLADPGYREYLLEDLMAGGVTAQSAAGTYLILHMAIAVLSVLGSGLLALCLITALAGQADRSLGALSTGAEWAVKGLNALGIGLGVLFVYKFAAYTLQCLQINGGVYPLFAMVISEALMAVIAWAVFYNLRRFLGCLGDAATGMAYTYSARKLSGATIPAFGASGFCLLGIVAAVLAVDQVCTLTIAYDAVSPYYKLLIAPEPPRHWSAASFLCGAAADILLWRYLRRFKRSCERILFQARKRLSKI